MTVYRSTGTLTPATVAKLEQNMFDYMTYLPDRCEAMEVIRLPEVWLINGGVPSATFNFICHTNLECGDDSPVHVAADYFAGRGQPVGWWTGPSCQPENIGDVLMAKGFVNGGTYPGLVVNLDPFVNSSGVDDESFRIARVDTKTSVLDFARIAGEVFDGSPESACQYYTLAMEFVLDPAAPFWMYLGYLNGQPVATCIAYYDSKGKTVGIYSVATLPKARRLGIGSALTSHALCEGARLGADYGTLQSSASGYPLYKKLGFERYGEFHLWLPPNSVHE